MMTARTERRIIMLGKTGNGKSSTGNSLLGRQAFHHEQSLNSVTQTCDVQRGDKYAHTKRYVIVDTPGLMDTEVKLAERALEIQMSATICPKSHAFLLIFSSKDRMTKDEEFTIDVLRVIFGEKVFEQCIIVFTHGNTFTSAPDFKKYWTKSNIMVMVERCGGRITTIENHSPIDSDVHRIFAMIEDMSGSGKNMFVYPWLKSHTRALKEHLANYQGKANVHEELSALVERLGKILRRDIWTVMLVGASYVVVAGVAVACICMDSQSTSAIVTSYAAQASDISIGIAWSLATKFRFW